ncbi:MAG: adenylate kinase [Acidimicrobiales bacterium]|nr:adenylate kinase [Acidimicrobiales bacterium]
MRRVSVVGCSGSGKSTLAKKLAASLDAPLLELDAVFHQRAWHPLPDDEFVERVRTFAEGETWVIDGNYSQVRETIVWPRVDTVIWVDPPRRTVMRRIIWRSLRRAILRQELWNGNRESWRNLCSWDPNRSIIRWSWTRYELTRARYEAAVQDSAWTRIEFLRLQTVRDAGLIARTCGADRSGICVGKAHA